MVTGLRGYAPASSALSDLGLDPGGAFGIAVREENRHSRFDRPVMTALSLRFRLMSRTVVVDEYCGDRQSSRSLPAYCSGALLA